MYAISIGGSSRSKLMFGATVVICIFYSVVFGLLVGRIQRADPLEVTPIYAGWSLAFIFVVHAAERFNRHVVDKMPYWEFARTEGK